MSVLNYSVFSAVLDTCDRYLWRLYNHGLPDNQGAQEEDGQAGIGAGPGNSTATEKAHARESARSMELVH